MEICVPGCGGRSRWCYCKAEVEALGTESGPQVGLDSRSETRWKFLPLSIALVDFCEDPASRRSWEGFAAAGDLVQGPGPRTDGSSRRGMRAMSESRLKLGHPVRS